MSSTPPPDVLDSGTTPPQRPRRGGGRLRRGLVVGGAVVLLGGVGWGAWAAYGFFQTGDQPAEMLPANTLAYVSVDLDPSGGQKIQALKTLNKFPAFEDAVGIKSDDDVREKLFDVADVEKQCPSIDYARDIKPWLGDRAAVAVVPDAKSDPDVVAVVQVSDADRAEQGLQALEGCGASASGSGAGDHLGWHIGAGWAVIADTDAIADKVAASAGDAALADDKTYQDWTGKVGDPGIVTMYAAPAAGSYLADHAGGLMSFSPMASRTPTDDQALGAMTSRLRDFKGAAATVRFDDGGVELSMAADSGASGTVALGDGKAGSLVESLPTDTGAALGVGLEKGWFAALLKQASSSIGMSTEQLTQQAEQLTGLALPQDAETLLGNAFALSVGPDVDAERIESFDAANVPVGLKIDGDPDAITSVLDKVTAQLSGFGIPPDVLGTATSGDSVALGPDADYRAELAKDGSLGDDDTFQGVLPDADKASALVYVDVDRYQALIRKLAGDDTDLVDNLAPISAFGAASWTEGDVTYAKVRLGTN